MKKNILLTIEYDGTGFCGWQRQPDVRTVQGVLEEVLSKVCNTKIELNGTSRTDAGVHALGQRASFSADIGVPTEKLAEVVNNMLCGRTAEPGRNADVRILRAVEVPESFHAQFDSRGKTYRYVIYNAKEMPVFLRNYRYFVEAKNGALAVDDMKRAAKYIEGTHDFACFQAAGSYQRETTVRTISSLKIYEEAAEPGRGCKCEAGSEITLKVTGDGFLYNMVRIIVGTLVDVGSGKILPEDIPSIIESGDRTRAGHTAPPQGLYLENIYFSEMEMK